MLAKALVALPLCLVLYCYELEPGCRAGYSLIQAFCAILFGAVDYQNSYVYIMTIENIAYIFLFDLMFAAHITGHFRYSCVYVFTRIHSRKKWSLARMAELLACAFVYAFLYVGGVLMISINAAQQPLTTTALIRVGMVFLFSFFLLSSTALSVNLLSLRYGTAIGLLVTVGSVLGLVALLLVFHAHPVAVLLNPLACLNLFNSGLGGALFTTAYNFVVLLVLLFAGVYTVSSYDVALFDAELT